MEMPKDVSSIRIFWSLFARVIELQGDGLQASERTKSDGKLKLWYEIGLSGDEIKIIKHRTITLTLHLRLNSILYRDYIVFIGFLRPPGSNSG